MEYKVGDIVEVIKILPEWDIYKDRHKIFNTPCRFSGYCFGMCDIEIYNGSHVLLKENRFKPFVEVGKQLEFDFMREGVL